MAVWLVIIALLINISVSSDVAAVRDLDVLIPRFKEEVIVLQGMEKDHAVITSYQGNYVLEQAQEIIKLQESDRNGQVFVIKEYQQKNKLIKGKLDAERVKNGVLQNALDKQASKQMEMENKLKNATSFAEAAREENEKLKNESHCKDNELQEKETIIRDARKEIDVLRNVKMIIPKETWFIVVSCLAAFILFLITGVIVLCFCKRNNKKNHPITQSISSTIRRETQAEPKEKTIKNEIVTINASNFEQWKSINATKQADASERSNSDEDLFKVANDNEGTKGTTKTIV